MLAPIMAPCCQQGAYLLADLLSVTAEGSVDIAAQ